MPEPGFFQNTAYSPTRQRPRTICITWADQTPRNQGHDYDLGKKNIRPRHVHSSVLYNQKFVSGFLPTYYLFKTNSAHLIFEKNGLVSSSFALMLGWLTTGIGLLTD